MCFGTSRCSHLCVCNIHLQLLLFTGSAQTFCLLLWSSVTFLHSKKQHQNFAKSKYYCSPNPLKLGFALHFLFFFFSGYSIHLLSLPLCLHPSSIYQLPFSVLLCPFSPCPLFSLHYSLSALRAGLQLFLPFKRSFPFALPRLSPFFSGVPYVNSQLRNVS